jgi:hypothetical protein
MIWFLELLQLQQPSQLPCLTVENPPPLDQNPPAAAVLELLIVAHRFRTPNKGEKDLASIHSRAKRDLVSMVEGVPGFPRKTWSAAWHICWSN